MKKIVLNLSQGRSEVWVGHGILKKIVKFFETQKPSRVFIIADIYFKDQALTVSKDLHKAGLNSEIQLIQISEEFKDFHRIYPIYGWLLRNGADRHSVIVALGGGVIGDLAGFLAGTYMRGIKWIGIPTTLVAQVDSSIGGKTGVNHQEGKNLIGVFHHPSLVVCELDFLQTLPKRELISGLGEMIKYGLIFDPVFFFELKRGWKKIVQLKPKVLKKTVYLCLKWKAKIIEKDELDHLGIREVLNFGHTVGHALEAECGYGFYRHGESVILGMRAASFISMKAGHLDLTIYKRIDSFLRQLPLPRIPKKIKTENLIRRIQLDKKSKGGKVGFILLSQIGKTFRNSNVSQIDLIDSLEMLKK